MRQLTLEEMIKMYEEDPLMTRKEEIEYDSIDEDKLRKENDDEK